MKLLLNEIENKEGGNRVPNIYGCHFEYANSSGTLVSSRTYGLIFASVDTGRLMQTEGQINGVTLFSKPAKKRYLIDDDYSESPLTFDVEIITDDNSILSVADRKNIERWLFNRHEYRKLYIDPLDDCDGDMSEQVNVASAVRNASETYPTVTPVYETKRLYLNCRFVNPERIETIGGTVGYKATLEADSNMWWQDPVTITVDVTRTGDQRYTSRFFRVPMNTDADIYCYPRVEFTVGSGAAARSTTIYNYTDNVAMGQYNKRALIFYNLPASQPSDQSLDPSPVITDGNTNYVSGDYYNYLTRYDFVRLAPSGSNEILVHGDILSVSVTYQNRRAFL